MILHYRKSLLKKDNICNQSDFLSFITKEKKRKTKQRRQQKEKKQKKKQKQDCFYSTSFCKEVIDENVYEILFEEKIIMSCMVISSVKLDIHFTQVASLIPHLHS